MKSKMNHMKLICCLMVAACIAACGEKENNGNGITSLDAPTGLKVSSKTTHSAIVVWDAVEGADSYEWNLQERAPPYSHPPRRTQM